MIDATEAARHEVTLPENETVPLLVPKPLLRRCVVARRAPHRTSARDRDLGVDGRRT